MDKEKVEQKYHEFVLMVIKEYPRGIGEADLISKIDILGMRNGLMTNDEPNYSRGAIDELLEEKKIESRNYGSKRYPTMKICLSD